MNHERHERHEKPGVGVALRGYPLKRPDLLSFYARFNRSPSPGNLSSNTTRRADTQVTPLRLDFTSIMGVGPDVIRAERSEQETDSGILQNQNTTALLIHLESA